MPQRAATIESLPMAFALVKEMQADGLEWGEGYLRHDLPLLRLAPPSAPAANRPAPRRDRLLLHNQHQSSVHPKRSRHLRSTNFPIAQPAKLPRPQQAAYAGWILCEARLEPEKLEDGASCVDRM